MNLFTDEIRTDAEAQKFTRQWIAALRSGGYAQGWGALRKPDDSFCCLGVACDLYDPSQWIEESYLGNRAGMPFEVVEHARLRSSMGDFYPSPPSSETDSLVRLNDNSAGTSFAEIANVIERELEAALA